MTKTGLILKAIFAANQQTTVESPIDRILKRISRLDIPDKEHFAGYMSHKYRSWRFDGDA